MSDNRDNQIVLGNCLEQMVYVATCSVDMVFADPPYGIGHQYDNYRDNLRGQDYLDWCYRWLLELQRVTRRGGAIWVMAHTDYVADVRNIAVREMGLTLRNWVIWRYTFGQNQSEKFTPSWVSLLFLQRPGGPWTWNDKAIRVPSARQSVYADKRANPIGKVPDDVWDDIPRLCGTHRERVDHPCQLPEALVTRAVLACTNPGDLVLDPFTGSGTTLAVAKKHGRRYLGFELSPVYRDIAERRLAKIGESECPEKP